VKESRGPSGKATAFNKNGEKSGGGKEGERHRGKKRFGGNLTTAGACTKLSFFVLTMGGGISKGKKGGVRG